MLGALQVDLYGALTQTEERRMCEAIDAAAVTTSHSASTEAALLAATRADVYSKALLQMQMAAFHSDHASQVCAPRAEGPDWHAVRHFHEQEWCFACEWSMTRACAGARLTAWHACVQAQLLGAAHAAIQQAQALERDLFAMATLAPPTARRERPQQPSILNRTVSSITISHHPLKLKGSTPAFFAVYGKSAGPGVALAINRTAMELQGCGVLQPIGASVTIQGLIARESYVFAIAAYDRERRLIGDLGVVLSCGNFALHVGCL